MVDSTYKHGDLGRFIIVLTTLYKIWDVQLPCLITVSDFAQNDMEIY